MVGIQAKILWSGLGKSRKRLVEVKHELCLDDLGHLGQKSLIGQDQSVILNKSLHWTGLKMMRDAFSPRKVPKTLFSMFFCLHCLCLVFLEHTSAQIPINAS